ncbi:MAG: hypothetical protein JXQ87_19710, partial [Bacteroidia bacterium]
MKRHIILLLLVSIGLASYGQSYESPDPIQSLVLNTWSNGSSQLVCQSDLLNGSNAMTSGSVSSWDFVNKGVDNSLRIYLDRQSRNKISGPFTIDFTVTYSAYGEDVGINPSSPPSTNTVVLSLDIDPTSGSLEIDEALHTFTGGYKVVVTDIQTSISSDVSVPSWSSISSLFVLETSMRISRAYKTSGLSSPLGLVIDASSMQATLQTGSNDIKIEWTHIDKAIAYDLEWTFIDAATSDNYEVDFDNNATRVYLDGTSSLRSYTIPNIYSEGYLFFRVRPYGLFGSNNDIVCAGEWSDKSYETGLKVIPFSFLDAKTLYPSGKSSYNVSGLNIHEEDKNWTLDVSFAEGGKNKVVVNYADGLNRSRQMVTRMSTDNETVVGETVYDHLGRPAIQVLPVPTNNSVIKFYDGFNLNSNGDIYTWRDFELHNPQIGEYTPDITVMNDGSGASQYYSDHQGASTSYHDDMIPDAHGYPFSQIEYMDDETGRIRRQSGVGITHKLGSGHETFTYYIKPTQYELDRLFGNNVGYASDYLKIVTVDPNGQYSVSYQDRAGNVIATALTGESPNQVDDLGTVSSIINKRDIVEEVGNEINLTSTSNSSVLAYDLLVTSDNSAVKVEHKFGTKNYEPCSGELDLCIDCVYDLTIEVYDENGLLVKDINNNDVRIVEVLGKVSNYNNNTLDNTCGAPLAYSGNVIDMLLDKGVYKVYKTLSVREDAIDYYAAQYIESVKANSDATCYETLDDFLARVDVNCETFESCKECNAYLSQLATGTAVYNEVAAMCSELCTNEQFGGVLDLSGNIYALLLQDVSPGGQYAAYSQKVEFYDDNDNAYTEHKNAPFYSSENSSEKVYLPLSLLNEVNKLPGIVYDDNGTDRSIDRPSWRKPILPHTDGSKKNKYLDASGNVATVEIDGVFYEPQDLPTVKDFVDNFQESWAASLVRYHPEYAYYEFHNDLKAANSLAFDKLFMETVGYQEAFDGGLFYPVKAPVSLDASGLQELSGYMQSLPSSPINFVNGDPAFSQSSVNKANFIKSLVEYRSFPSDITVNYSCSGCSDPNSLKNDEYLSIWEIAWLTALGYDFVDGDNNWSYTQMQDELENNYDLLTTATTGCADAVKQRYWATFKYLYYSEKQRFLREAADEYALTRTQYNGCIGVDAGEFEDNLYVQNRVTRLIDKVKTFFAGKDVPNYDPEENSTNQAYHFQDDPNQNCYLETERLKSFSQKSKRFTNDVYSAVGLDVDDSNIGELIDALEANAEELRSSTKNVDDPCSKNVEYWMEQLSSCVVSHSSYFDSEGKWITTNQTYIDITSAFTAICKEGQLNNGNSSEFRNPYGVTKLSGNKTITYDGNEFNSFQDVLDHYLGSLDVNGDPIFDKHCTALKINYPDGDEISGALNNGYWPHLDKCGCDIITSSKDAYDNLPVDSKPESFMEYFTQETGIITNNLNDLLCLCENLASDKEVEDYEIPVPRGLTCQNCISCTQLSPLVVEFECETGIDIQTITEQEIITVSNRMTDIEVFTGYFNNYFGFHYTWFEVYDLLNCCELTESSRPCSYDETVTQDIEDALNELTASNSHTVQDLLKPGEIALLNEDDIGLSPFAALRELVGYTPKFQPGDCALTYQAIRDP